MYIMMSHDSGVRLFSALYVHTALLYLIRFGIEYEGDPIMNAIFLLTD